MTLIALEHLKARHPENSDIGQALDWYRDGRNTGELPEVDTPTLYEALTDRHLAALPALTYFAGYAFEGGIPEGMRQIMQSADNDLTLGDMAAELALRSIDLTRFELRSESYLLTPDQMDALRSLAEIDSVTVLDLSNAEIIDVRLHNALSRAGYRECDVRELEEISREGWPASAYPKDVGKLSRAILREIIEHLPPCSES